MQPTLIYVDETGKKRTCAETLLFFDLFMFYFFTFGLESLYLKLDNGVLVYINVPGGNGVLSKLAGNEHHG